MPEKSMYAATKTNPTIISDLKRTKIELLDRAYARVEDYFSKPWAEIQGDVKTGEEIFRDFFVLCFKEMGANRKQYLYCHGPTAGSLSRWLTGVSLPPSYCFRPLCKQAYEFTRQELVTS